jgi:dipeptidyl aminopeptidase/acylaminoacyl peptidase
VTRGVRRWAAALLAASTLTVNAGDSVPVPAPPLSIEQVFQPPSVLSMRLSPDGRSVAMLAQVKDARVVLLMDAQTLDTRPIHGPFDDWRAPSSVSWVGNELLAINRIRAGTIIDRSGQVKLQLGGVYLRTVRPGPDGHERILARQSWDSYYIRRIDVQTGESTLLNFDMPGDPTRWIVDRDGVPLVVSTRSTAFWSDDTTVTHWHRARLDDKWQKLASFPALEVDWWPAYLSRDGKSLVVHSSRDRDTGAYFRFDLAERRLADLMAGHPSEDIGYIESWSDDRYERVVTSGMKPWIHWFDPAWAALQRTVDAALPGRINWLSGQADGRVLVESYGDVDPGHWYLLETQSMRLRKIAAARPAIDPARMLAKRIVSYRSLDGLAIPAYLTLPAGAKGPFPAVVLVHGGPMARDRWNWDPVVQLLASRGYAVLQPQFRGSAGFGNRFRQAGHHQWGLAMQDDVTAGAQWLAAEGHADPNRICIYGGSYGGYAAVWGLIKTPDLFRCGVSFAGVSDLTYMFKDDSDVNDDPVARLSQRRTVGDPKTQQQAFDAVSPLKNAALIKAPLLLVHGNEDERVPIAHSRKLLAELRRHRKSVEWLELEGEGHGIWGKDNRQRFYDALLRFLDTHIGRPQSP